MDIRPPLYSLFRQLKDAKLDLSMDQYLLALRLVGLGVSDKHHLHRLLRTLWTTSKADAFLLEVHFERLFANYEPVSSSQLDPDQKEGLSKQLNDEQRSNQKGGGAESNDGDSQAGEAMSRVERVSITGTADSESRKPARELYLPHKETSLEFILTPTYTPITERDILQSWKQLRHWENSGAGRELDIPAIVAQIGRQGFYLKPCYRSTRVNTLHLYVLADRGGSMVAFHALSDQLAKSVAGFGNVQDKNTFFFHDQPNEVLYLDAALKYPVPVENWKKNLSAKNALVLFISDAGAARGSFSPERIGATFEFISKIKPATRQIVWLNPVPESRWEQSSAIFIRQFVPMFETNIKGIRQTIDYLKGQPL